MLNDGDTFIRAGHSFRFRVERDGDMGAPWVEHDGHGEVSDWTSRDKRPGELVLSSDRGRLHRFYDFRGACAKAQAEGWGTKGDDGLSPRAKAAMAARADFERMRDWCLDRWEWVGVVVELLDEDGEPAGPDDSLWGIESDAGDYLETVAHELAETIALDLVPSGLDALRAIVACSGVEALADPVL